MTLPKTHSLYGAAPNLYSGKVSIFRAAKFGRCKHGHTLGHPCWRCGVFHPMRWVRHMFLKRKYGL